MYLQQLNHGISRLQSPSTPSNLSLNPDVEPYSLLLRLSIVTLLLAVWCYRGFWLVCPQTAGPESWPPQEQTCRFTPQIQCVGLISLILPWLSSASKELGRRSFATDRIKPPLGPETLDPNTHEPQINQSDWIGLSVIQQNHTTNWHPASLQYSYANQRESWFA